MDTKAQLLSIIPVLPSSDILRDTTWYKVNTGFESRFFDEMYAVLYWDNLSIHLQWHADTVEDPLPGGSVVRVFVKNIVPLFEEFVEKGTVNRDRFVENTPWKTNEFGFYDLNKNAIYFVEDLD